MALGWVRVCRDYPSESDLEFKGGCVDGWFTVWGGFSKSTKAEQDTPCVVCPGTG